MTESLPVPDTVTADESSIEIVRVWGANNEQHITIDVGTWDEPLGWGLLLADLARHIAIAYGEEGDVSVAEALALIKQRMDGEWEKAVER